jgi:uncharacterized protein (DUF1330 family)
MTAYAMAQLRSIEFNDDIRVYLRRIDDTLTPYGGRFLVHGSTPEVVDGTLDGAIVLIGFPDLDAARAWYDSAEYQAILPLRTRNSDGGAALLPGVPAGYRAMSYVDKVDKAG